MQKAIFINGKEVGVDTRKHIAFLPDTIIFPRWMKVKDALCFYSEFFDDFVLEKANSILDSLDISKNIKIHDLSRGTIEKFSLALLLSRDANLYLLDEPLAYVDPLSRETLVDLILKNLSDDKTIIISTNIISEVEHLFDEIIILKEGRIVYMDLAENLREKSGLSVNQFFKEVDKK